MEIDRLICVTAVLFSWMGTLKAQVSQPLLSSQSSMTSKALAAQGPAYDLTVKVQRVVVDVVVTDANGNPVEGLKQDDFKVSEDGALQSVHFFDVHNAAASRSQQQALDLDLHLPANTFSNLTLVPPDKPVTVLLYDMLDTPQSSFPSAHQALVNFIRGQRGSTKTAIFVLTDRLHMLQGFTDDETRLMQAVNSKGATTQAPPLRAGTFSDLTDILLTSAEAAEAGYMAMKRGRATVEAFTEIAYFVSSLPGRKNLIWMSGSFPREIFSYGMPAGALVEPDVRVAKKLMDKSRVAVYPVDVRGLQTDPRYSAATDYPSLMGSFGVQQGIEHAMMNDIAISTGGRAFYNTNGLKEAMDTAVRQGSEYYTLTYAPTNKRSDGTERSIKVALKYPGYQLAYRRSYLADDARHPDPVKPLALEMSMQHGAPNSSELFFEAKVTVVGGSMPASPDEVQALSQVHQLNAKGVRAKVANVPPKVQHYDVSFALVGRELQMPSAGGGQYATDMRFGLAAYTADSELLNGMDINIKNLISAAQYQKTQVEGYHTSFPFVVPEGAVSLRMAVRDEIGKRIGTMEVPLPIAKGTNTAATP